MHAHTNVYKTICACIQTNTHIPYWSDFNIHTPNSSNFIILPHLCTHLCNPLNSHIFYFSSFKTLHIPKKDNYYFNLTSR